MKKVIKSLRNLTFKSCLEEKEVRLLGFCVFTPEQTRDIILPNGEHNKKRTVIRVKLTEVFKRRFKKTAEELRDGLIDIDDICRKWCGICKNKYGKDWISTINKQYLF